MLLPQPPSLPDTRCLLYVMDPMCSWCWAFAETLQQLKLRLPTDLPCYTLMGGLAADSDEPMPKPMQHQIQQIWKEIESRTGTAFNHDFWTRNTPRRSTYPACRAVIAAATADGDLSDQMISAIQQGYYLEAQNPSDTEVLTSFAENLGVSAPEFEKDLISEAIDQQLRQHLDCAAKLGIQGFPSLLYYDQQQLHWLSHGYATLTAIEKRLVGLEIELSAEG
ncbi:MAG: DsbA family protein [Motiliproteus sp.]|nr:DsbA family protein [Motiliproteus sp.]MCW9052581.1 DsbA family protein [Motiliproteus sp.]